MKLKTLCGACLVALIAAAPAAQAAIFQVTGQLTGDPRPGNPDNLVVDVTIDVNGNTALWTVDLNSMAAHPDMKLDVFAFNLLAPAANYSFSNFSPSEWDIILGDGVQGSGGASFMFEANDPPQNSNNVTNSVPLTFTMTYDDGVPGSELTLNHFLGADESCSNDTTLGCGQMGAHLQSLNAVGDESDSGFAFGNYEGEDQPGEVPEPVTLALLGLGLAGLGLVRRRRV